MCPEQARRGLEVAEGRLTSHSGQSTQENGVDLDVGRVARTTSETTTTEEPKTTPDRAVLTAGAEVPRRKRVKAGVGGGFKTVAPAMKAGTAYVSVHAAVNAAGEIRGQVTKAS